jgi:hypothetical protein
MKKTLSILSLFVLVASFLFSSCQKERMPDSEALVAGTEVCKSQDYPLILACLKDAGTVNISNDGTNVYVKVTINEFVALENVINNIKLWVGPDAALIPKMDCMPDLSKFPFTATVDASLKTYTFTISYAALSDYHKTTITCSSQLYVVTAVNLDYAAYPYVGYAGDINVQCGDACWSYASYQGVCCAPGTTETAFAKGGYVFATDSKANPENLPSLLLSKDRWGWAINIPTTNATYTYDVWAGAGLNYTSMGDKVGMVTVTVSGSTVTVKYEMLAGYSMAELHVYAGDLKPTTIAPGQYGYTQSFSPYATTHEASFNLTDTNGDGFWLIAHAVAYGSF